ncbi:unnamed protein product [Thelazia callipaeda]|uniref:RNase_PH domain-containing protein n=1 Tax=Thelazia callipaeda TaxID=103827 RepID=A0A158RCV3_THECL|nr:unnamed protein product [Thelazia callipaeda]
MCGDKSPCTECESSSEGDCEDLIPCSGEVRKLDARINFLLRSDGSCALEQGANAMWCGIVGPGDVAATKRIDDRLLIDIIYKHCSGSEDSVKTRRLLEAAIDESIDYPQFPRSVLCVVLQELQIDGSETAAALNAASLAALDSGIKMSGVFCGVTAAFSEGVLILDPNQKQSYSADALYNFVFRIDKQDSISMVACDTDGVFEYNTFKCARKFAEKASLDVFTFFREVLQKKLAIDISV